MEYLVNFDVVVIGGGPSGLMASIAASEQGKKVLLIEKGHKLGRKLVMSGGGRCNVTNRLPVDEIIKHVPGNGRFLYSAFAMYDNEDIISFFESVGVGLKEEDHGRMFPTTNKSRDVLEALAQRMEELDITIWQDCPVKKIHYKNQTVDYVETTRGDKVYTPNVVVSVGGQAVPKTGSTGDGYVWAKEAGHKITPLFPTEVPILSDEPFILDKTLQGISLREIDLTVLNPKNKVVVTHKMDMIFTHFGISGPAALRCSSFVIKTKEKYKVDTVTMKLDQFPDLKLKDLEEDIMQRVKNDPKKQVKNALKGLIQERLLLFFIERLEIDPEEMCVAISPKKWVQLASVLKDFRFVVKGTYDFDKAFVTGGGVSVKEIIPKEMQSKKIAGLYFSGEILDIHGYTGGFNITCALVTGRLAGYHAGTRDISVIDEESVDNE